MPDDIKEIAKGLLFGCIILAMTVVIVTTLAR